MRSGTYVSLVSFSRSPFPHPPFVFSIPSLADFVHTYRNYFYRRNATSAWIRACTLQFVSRRFVLRDLCIVFFDDQFCDHRCLKVSKILTSTFFTISFESDFYLFKIHILQHTTSYFTNVTFSKKKKIAIFILCTNNSYRE